MKRALAFAFAGLAFSAGALAQANDAAAPPKVCPPEVIAAYADAPRDEVCAAWIGSQYLLERDYDRTFVVLQEIAKSKPNSLLPSMGTMFAYHVRMLENFDFRYLKEFKVAEEQNVRLMRTMFRRKTASRWEMLMAGASLGMRGMIQARKQNYLKSAALGFESVGIMRDIKFEGEGLPPMYDVLYGIGMYNYWISWAQQRSLILAFLPDRTQEGLRDLAICAEKAPLTGAVAGFALAYLYGQEGRMKEALARAKPLVEAYPQNIIFRSLWGRLLIGSGQVDQGIAVLDGIMKQEPTVIYLSFHLGKALYLHHREPDRVIKLLEAFLTEPGVKRLAPVRSEANLMVADLYAQRKDWLQAKVHLEEVEVRQLPPSFAKTYQELKRMLRKT